MKKFTMFDQIMESINQKVILDSIVTTESDKWSKTFKTKDHLAVMIFAQLMNCKSLRELAVQFNAMKNEKYVEIKRSTLSDANSQRVSKVFEDLCAFLINKQGIDTKINKNTEKVLKILDSTPIMISHLRTLLSHHRTVSEFFQFGAKESYESTI